MFRIHDASYPCALRREFWAQRAYQIEWIEGDVFDVRKAKSADLILIEPRYSGDYLLKKDRMSRALKLLGFADHISLKDGLYWPGALSLPAFRKLVITHAKTLDLGVRAYVTGTSPWARLAILTAFDIGYRHVRIIGENDDEAQQIIEEFSKFCFGLTIATQDRAHLTLQPNNGSLLINTESLIEDPELLAVLMYLNFIHRDGMIADLAFQLDEGALCAEATASGFKCLNGAEFRGSFDFEILLSRGLVKATEVDEYLGAWSQFLKTKLVAPPDVPAAVDSLEKPAKDPVSNS